MFPLPLFVLASSFVLSQGVPAYGQRQPGQGLRSGLSFLRRDNQPRVFRGNQDRIDPAMTRRTYDPTFGGKKRTRAPGDSSVIRQTRLLTYRINPAVGGGLPTPQPNIVSQCQDAHPNWTADEKFIYFDSNRVSETNTASNATGANPSGTFNIYRMTPDGAGVAQVTTGAENKIEPSVSVDGSRMAYVGGGTITYQANGQDVSAGFSLFVVNLTAGTAPINLTLRNPSGFNFVDVRRPTFAPGGDRIAFAGRLAGENVYHIFTVNTDTGRITQLTVGNSNDTSPAWSPDGNLIAFTTNAVTFSTGPGPVTSTSLRTNTEIFVISPNQFSPNPKRVTGAGFGSPVVASNNRNPAWSSLRPDPLRIIPNETNPNGDVSGAQQLLAFASDRADSQGNGIADSISANGSTDIYYLVARIRPDPNVPGAFTVTTPEAPGNLAIKLRTSTPDIAIDPNDPSFRFDPNFRTSEDYPAWPQYINSYRLAFQSNRSGTAPDVAADPANNLNIWGATMFDINAPTLLKYDMGVNQIVGVFRDNNAPVPPGQNPAAERAAYVREVSAGEVVRFRARAADYESGIESVWIQIKTPASAQTSADGREHKIFYSYTASLDQTTAVPQSPYEIECQAINPKDYSFRQNGFVPPTAQAVFGSIPADWPGWNLYMAGLDDEFAFSGGLNPPDDDFWLRLWDDGPVNQGGHEPLGEVAGDGIYSAAWVTPTALPSDWYIDVIIRDRAINPFDTDIQVNWKIYDNVWGFTTQPWNSQGQILYVNDYDIGQKFFQTRFGTGTRFFLSFNGVPTESWMTEHDQRLIPRFYVRGTSPPAPLTNVLFPLGANSYGQGFAPDNLVNDGTSVPVTQRYDQWRILARGPIPDTILNQYGARIQQQPDPANPRQTRPVVVAERCVIWHAPYPGNLFIGPGTIAESSVQDQLARFIAAGGRIFLNGQDVAWALSLGQPGASAFLDQNFRVRYVADFPPPPFTQITMPNVRVANPIGAEYWALPVFHAFPPFITGPPFNTPPASGPVYMASYQGTVRDWMAPNPNTPDQIAVSPNSPNTTIEGTYPGGGGPAIVWTTNPTTRSKTVFSSFGWEALNPEHFDLPGTPPVVARRNVLAEMIHNIGCFLRTGRIVGSVRDVNGAAPLANVLVQAVSPVNGQVIATAFSQTDGSFVLNGLDATGVYTVDARRAGYSTAHLQGVPFHGGYQSRLDVFLTQAQPGSISGRVTLRSDPNVPIAGAIVVATNPDTGESYTDTTRTDGTYSIRNVPALFDGNNADTGYVVRITNLGDLGFGNSVPPRYGRTPLPAQPGEQPPVQVGDGVVAPRDRVDINFALNPLPGRITGRIGARDVDGNIINPFRAVPGATVTATSGATVLIATTDNNGAYTIDNAEPGLYAIVAVAPGFQQSPEERVTVVTNQTLNAPDIYLSRTPPGSISGIVWTRLNDPNTAVRNVTIRLTDLAGNPLRDADGNLVPEVTTGTVQTANGNYSFNYRFPAVPAGGDVRVVANPTTPDGDYRDLTGAITTRVNSGEERRNINFLFATQNSFISGLSLVSAPYDYTSGPNAAPINQLLRPAPVNFSFVAWQNDQYVTNPTVPADTFRLGRGYFLDLRAGAASILRTGVTAPTDRPFEIRLRQGWNLIGAPFTFPVNFLSLRIRDDNGGATGPILDVPAAQTGTNPAISGALWTFESGAYQLAFTLDPWRGYWLRAFRPCTLLVEPSARQDRSQKARGNTTGEGWELNLMAQAGAHRAAPAYMGVNRLASNSYDAFKMEVPPPVTADGVTLTFDHNDWGNFSGRYSRDVRSPSNDTQSWTFTVRANVPNEPILLTWPNVATVPKRYQMILTDLDTQTVVNLRNRSSYTVAGNTKPMTRQFRLDVKPATRQSLDIMDISARINGSGTRSANSASIAYRVTSDANVQVTILRGGLPVRRLEAGRHRAAGPSEVIWDLNNDAGTPVPANTYTVEIRATDSEGYTIRRVTSLLITR
jgi:hypothetical protein